MAVDHIGKRIFESFARNELRTALKIGDARYSYGRLGELAWQVASCLCEKTVAGQRVGIFVQKQLAAYQGVLGTLFSGRVYVPINPRHSKEKIASIVEQAEISVVITSKSLLLENIGLLYASGIKTVIVPEQELTEDELPHAFEIIDQQELAQWSGIGRFHCNDDIYLMFTSGSTGVPKGVPINDTNLCAFLDNANKCSQLAPGFVASQTFDLSFDLSVADLFFTWTNGGQLTVLGQEEMYCANEFIQRENIELWFSVPALADFMRQLGALQENAFPSIRRSLFCGEALTKTLARAWRIAAPNSTIENCYGPTETTIFISRREVDEVDLQETTQSHYVPIGEIFADHQCALVDGDNQRVVQGDKGELVVKGDQLSCGYLNNVEKTQQVFLAMPWDRSSNNRWYKTGDLVSSDGENLYYWGRLDNQIKIAGRRIELGEIEKCLQIYGGLDPVVVVPVYDDEGIIVSLEAYTTVSLDKSRKREIKQHCEGHIEPLFYPKKIHCIEKFPTNLNGKVDRKKLRSAVLEC